MGTTGTAIYQINLNTNNTAGGKMKSDSGREGRLIRNTDVRGEFEKIFKDPNSLSFWKNYIRKRLKENIISKYERTTTEDDILSILQMKIFDKSLEWDKDVYRDFKHFMYGQLQNIIRNKEIILTKRYEKYLLEEEPGKKQLTAKPMNHTETDKEFVEINMDRIGNPLNERDDKFAYYSSIPKKELDKNKFKYIVREMLKEVRYTDLLVVFTGLMENKTRGEIKAEYGFTEREYENSYKRLLYKLRRELPVEYKEMYLTDNN
jgi:hypothetical protein